jgi:hypothetical protein
MREVPEFFQAAVQSYDSFLRVRWSVHLENFVLERKITNPQPGVMEKLKGLLYRQANRKLFDGLETDEIRAQLTRRYEAAAHLEAIQGGYRILELLPGVGLGDMEMTLGWLRRSDMWARTKYDGDADKAATKIALADFYEEEFQRQEGERKRRISIREGLRDYYPHFAHDTGSRVSMAGAGR